MSTKSIAFLPAERYVKILGRSIMLDDCRLLSLSGSGVEFSYIGTKITVTFFGDSSTKCGPDGVWPWRDQARVAVFVDGIKHLDTTIKSEKETYVICNDGPNVESAEHIVRIIKLSEPRMSTIGLGEIVIEAEDDPKPTPLSDKYIEFIGDSITCGYGIDTPNEFYNFSTSTENASKAFAYKTAQALGADYSLVSYSGHGLISGFTLNPEVPTLTELVQPYYEILSYSYHKFRGQKMQCIKWDFENTRKPDTIVINLGTNDSSYVQEDEMKRLAFEEDYVEFLEQVHNVNPQARIIAAFGLMGDSLFETEKSAIETFKENTGFNEVYACHLTPQDFEKNGYVADFHPTDISHTIAAKELTDFIKSLGGKYAI